MPIKVVHFADAHLGVDNSQQIDPATGMSVCLGDFLKSFDAVIDAAIEGQADLVIFAGDAYKTRTPSPTYQREFADRIMRLSLAGVPTVLVAGNHDVSNAYGHAHTLQIFDTLNVDNIHVARFPMVFHVETRDGPVQVGVLPWVGKSGFLTRDEYKDKSLEEVSGMLVDRVGQILNGDGGLVSRLTPDVPHILVAHGTVVGAVYGSEQSVVLGHDMALPINFLKNSHWDYVAMGHIHKHQEVGKGHPPVVYSGSIERIDFGEEKEDKGFVIAEVESGHCSWSFQKLDTRPFVTVRVKAEGNDPTAQVVAAIEEVDIEGAIVRVFIQTTPEYEALIRDSDIRRALKGCQYVSAFTHEVERTERIRLGSQGDASAIAQMPPLEALEKYLQVKEVPPERIEVLRKAAVALIGGAAQ